MAEVVETQRGAGAGAIDLPVAAEQELPRSARVRRSKGWVVVLKRLNRRTARVARERRVQGRQDRSQTVGKRAGRRVRRRAIAIAEDVILDIYAEVGRPLGLEHTLELWLLVPGGVAGGLAFDRSERDFSERDVRVLETLRPHLVQLWRNARLRRSIADSFSSSAAGLLTPREREVLAWVARGKTNREIAAVLYLAPGTVRKHLDNVYAKLDVGSRAGAVARAFLN